MTTARQLIDRYAVAARGPDLPGLKDVQSRRAAELVRRLKAPHSVAVLGDPVGTGKTVIALTVAALLLETAKVERVVVVTPNAAVRRIWEERAEHLKPAFRGDTLRIHTASTVPASVKKDALIVVDEAHRRLNRDGVDKLIRHGPGAGSQRRLLLTATPFQISVSDLAELVSLGDREGTTEETATALTSYGQSITKLARHAHKEPDRYLAEDLRLVAATWSSHADKLILPQLTAQDEKTIGLPAMHFPDMTPVPLGTDRWLEAFHVARIVPELTDVESTKPSATDSFQRGLASSVAAFWAHKATRSLDSKAKRVTSLRKELRVRLGSGVDHPKVAFTTDWVAGQVRQGSHVAVFCVWDATARELQDTISQRLLDDGLNGDVHRPGASITKAQGERFRSGTADPLVLILQERFSESIDLDGGDPALVHHDLPWNPARLRQRWGRFVRASSGFTPIPAEKILVPVLAHETDVRVYDTVRVRHGIGEVLLSEDMALDDQTDSPIDPVDWFLRNLRRQP